MKTNKAIFLEKVKKNLPQLTTGQKRTFAWLCAVRALPFLSIQRSFGYWDKPVKQRYLQTVFYALDRIIWYNNSFSYAYAAQIEGKIIARTLQASSHAAHNNGASIAANVVKTIEQAIQNHAANAAANAAHVKPEFQALILQDLDAIRENKLKTLQNDTAIYGGLWQRFQEDLTAMGCGSWAKLYAEIFSRRFYFDINALKQRVNVPLEYIETEIPKHYGGKSEVTNWIINNIKIDQKLYFINESIKQEIIERGEAFMNEVSNHYTFNGSVGSVDRHDTVTDNSTHFHAATAELRDIFNDMAQALESQGEAEASAQARMCAGDCSEAVQCGTAQEAKKKGLFKRMGKFMEDLGDEKSALHRKFEGLKVLSDKTAWMITKLFFFSRQIGMG